MSYRKFNVIDALKEKATTWIIDQFAIVVEFNKQWKPDWKRFHDNPASGKESVYVIHPMCELEPIINKQFRFSKKENRFITSLVPSKRSVEYNIDTTFTLEDAYNIVETQIAELNRIKKEDLEKKEKPWSCYWEIYGKV